jgi:hypothetical protein
VKGISAFEKWLIKKAEHAANVKKADGKSRWNMIPDPDPEAIAGDLIKTPSEVLKRLRASKSAQTKAYTQAGKDPNFVDEAIKRGIIPF